MLNNCFVHSCNNSVAPLVGAWIEINFALRMTQGSRVAPLVGAWIEIKDTEKLFETEWSLLSWERGLK